MKRPYFSFTQEMEQACNLFQGEERETLLQAIIAYGLRGESPCLSGTMKFIWDSMLLPRLSKGWKQYRNGLQGGHEKGYGTGNINARKNEPKTNPKTNPKQSQNEPKNEPKTTPLLGIDSAETKYVNDDLFGAVSDKENESSPAPFKGKENNTKKNITEVILKENPDIERRFNALNEWLRTDCPFVLKVKRQLTIAEYAKLRYRFDKSWRRVGDRYTSDELKRALMELNNWADFPKKRTTVYLSALEQLERNNGKREGISA